MVQVKICGLTDEAMIDVALDAGADFIGLIAVPASPRYVPPERAIALAQHVLGRGAIPVIVSTQRTPVHAAMSEHPNQGVWLQLHGAPQPQDALTLARETGASIIQALPVHSADDLQLTRRFTDVADWLLLDAKAPDGADRSGGHGVPFDWSILGDWHSALPWFLAGGLTPDTVADAIARTGAFGVDVSSGVEMSPGVKDPTKVRDFIHAAKR